ncbi:MAG: DUF4105 domain-containing protein [Bacteroidaceae bacterium]|jgi:hypothetical protein|nr:DUF4105 domain-containing protein [Bacteroidaceae bacterium]
MATHVRHIYLLAFILLAWLPMSAQDASSAEDSASVVSQMDSIEVSLLTCTPGKDMYAKFGHTALRVRDYTIHRDVVFNYGCFDYNANNFVLKFVLGQTDYLLDAEEFEFLKYRYGMLGNGVSEQVLNLSQEEANRLLTLLLENLRPENQEYRYNWLYDNCTERARDMIEKAVDGHIEYAKVTNPEITVREMLHHCLETSPWVAFGIDLILGAEIDQKVTDRIMMFLPDVLRRESDGAHIIRQDGTQVEYISGRAVVLEDTNEPEKAYTVGSPLFVFSLLLLFTLALFAYELRHRRYVLWMDVVMHVCQGLAGLLVAFLFFLSEHPAVDSNWLVIILNPLPLLYVVWLIYCQRTKRHNRVAYINLAVLSAFLVTMTLCPQSFNPATWLMVVSLLIRALSQAHFASPRAQRRSPFGKFQGFNLSRS